MEKLLFQKTIDEAVRAVSRLIRAEVAVMNQLGSVRGVSKKAEREEQRAATDLFTMLTGVEPTPEQLKEMVEL